METLQITKDDALKVHRKMITMQVFVNVESIKAS